MDINPADFEEALITAVREQKILWNRRPSVRPTPNQWSQIWQQVATAVIPNFSEQNSHDQAVLAHQLRKQWRTIRDRYRKYKLGQRRAPSQQIQQLSFLDEILLKNGINCHKRVPPKSKVQAKLKGVTSPPSDDTNKENLTTNYSSPIIDLAKYDVSSAADHSNQSPSSRSDSQQSHEQFIRKPATVGYDEQSQSTPSRRNSLQSQQLVQKQFAAGDQQYQHTLSHRSLLQSRQQVAHKEMAASYGQSPRTNTNEDGDIDFFKSLLTKTKDFSMDEKLEFGEEALKLIRKIRSNRNRAQLQSFINDVTEQEGTSMILDD